MNWLLIYEIVYIIILILVCLRIIYDTRSSTKTLAYLLLVIFLPFAGIFFYFSFGINYRKRKMYSKKLFEDRDLAKKLREDIYQSSKKTFENNSIQLHGKKRLALLLLNNNMSGLTGGNNVKLLVNGEQKLPEVIKALEQAEHHIHIEYYIYEDDETGRAIEEVLIRKAREGVTVRFIYDDFGSYSIRKKLVKRLRNGGVQAFPFHKIIFIALANRLNYRNHRKIIVIDGAVGFVGGINISDRYVNKPGDQQKLYWRDTHLKIEGPGVHYLQYLFLCDWNFCARENLQPSREFFPPRDTLITSENKIVQIAASGPDSDNPAILFSILQAVSLAKKEILITTPYFVPGESIIDALAVASLSGVEVKILLPGRSDYAIVNTAARSYYNDLLKAGAEIYLYQKGFIHAKTLAVDGELAIVGTANMDYRSFDLNFEVNALVYCEETAGELREIFYKDLDDSVKIDAAEWGRRPLYKQLWEKTVKLISPFL